MKDILKTLLSNPVYVCGGIFLLSAGSLVFALSMQHLAGLQPCDLCILQRWPFVVTTLLGLAGLIAAIDPDRLKITSFTVFLSSLSFFAGGGLGFYHAGVEQHWWRSFLEGCKVELPPEGESILEFIQNAKAVPCDNVPWEFLGLSMAGWNAVMSLTAGAVCLAAAILLARRANNFL
jgi:disulfide bond formation protein DsbB